MNRIPLAVLAIVAIVHLALSVSGCTRESPKQGKAESAVQKAPVSKERVPDNPALSKIEVPVPNEIKNHLLRADDIRGGAELHAKTIVVDADQTRLLISGRGRFLCSPTGNCPYWIFRKTAVGYEQEVDLGVAQTVRAERRAKLPEIVAEQHSSATDSGLRLYQFDRAHYRLTKCMSQSYQDPTDGHILEKPIVTEVPCQ